MKARRKDDPSNFVLVEEVPNSDSDKSHRTKVERRTLSDDDNVYTTLQHRAAKFILTERSKAAQVTVGLVLIVHSVLKHAKRLYQII